MAQVFNPWANPPTDGTLSGDLASFEINDMDGPEDSADSAEQSDSPEHGAMMTQALQVISQQAALIDKLMATLGK